MDDWLARLCKSVSRSIHSESETNLDSRTIFSADELSAVLLPGIAVGHAYYFLEDVFPNKPGGVKLLQTPRLMYVRPLVYEPRDHM